MTNKPTKPIEPIKPMKAKHYKDLAESKRAGLFPCYVFEKYDGVFAHIYRDVDTDAIHILSRQGKPLIGFDWLLELFNMTEDAIEQGEHIFGELYNDEIEFDEFNGLVRNHEECICDFNMFDYYYDGYPLHPFCDRLDVISDIVDMVDDDRVKYIVDKQVATCQADVDEEFADIMEQGGEGVILRPVNSIYAPGKRSNDYIKLKEGIDEDVVIDYITEALEKDTDKPLGMAGSMNVIRNKISVRIGMGNANHEQRTEMWNNRETYKGKIVQLKAMSVTKSGAYRHGNFFRMREDKSNG